jgi:hypothetical protein
VAAAKMLHQALKALGMVDVGIEGANGRRQLPWPLGDNYLGRFEAGNDFLK